MAVSEQNSNFVTCTNSSEMLKVTHPHSATSHSPEPLDGNPSGLPTQWSGDLRCPALRDCPPTSDLQNANHFANRPTVICHSLKTLWPFKKTNNFVDNYPRGINV